MRDLADPRHAEGARRFFKTAPGQYGAGDRFLGIRVPALRKLAAKHRTLSARELSALLSSPWHEERLLALFILVRQYSKAEATHRRAIYRLYMRHTARINNWDLVDCSAEHIVGAHLRDGDRGRLYRLARSRDLCERRIAILATYHYIKRGEFDDTLRIARLPRTMLRYAIERFPERLRRRYLAA